MKLCLVFLLALTSHLCHGQSSGKCSYRPPRIPCGMFGGWFVVYNEEANNCYVETSACRQEDIQPFAFETEQECRETCVVEKCNYRVPTISCHLFIGNHIVYDSATGSCVSQSYGCDRNIVQRHSFQSPRQCERTCRNARRFGRWPENQPRLTQTGLISDTEKCQYQVPSRTCAHHIGRHIVFNSRRNQCIIQSTGCSSTELAKYEFQSIVHCEATCVVEKCNHRIEEKPCDYFIGSYIVYDRNTGECVRQSRSCDINDVLRNSFDTLAECQATCVNRGLRFPTTTPVATVRPTTNIYSEFKCGYLRPKVTCLMNIGQHIVFDKDSGTCRVESIGCNSDDVAPYAFGSKEECLSTCAFYIATRVIGNPNNDGLSVKCRYRRSLAGQCNNNIGRFIVFDSLTGLCIVESLGCSPHAVQPFAFDNMVDCVENCYRPTPGAVLITEP